MNLTMQAKGQVLVIKLAGELDHHTSANVRESIETELKNLKPVTLILNLEELDFMDSSGLGVILGRYKSLLESGGELLLCSINPAVSKLLEMAGLLKMLKVYENESAALDSCGVAS